MKKNAIRKERDGERETEGERKRERGKEREKEGEAQRERWWEGVSNQGKERERERDFSNITKQNVQQKSKSTLIRTLGKSAITVTRSIKPFSFTSAPNVQYEVNRS